MKKNTFTVYTLVYFIYILLEINAKIVSLLSNNK